MLGTNPKALGTNPRALGVNARNLRVSPKQLGVNPQAVADLSVEERAALIAAIQTRNTDSGYSHLGTIKGGIELL